MWTRFYLAIYILLPCVQSVKICSSDLTSSGRFVNVEMENVSGPCTCDITVSATPHTTGHLPNKLQFQSVSNNGGQCSEFKLMFKNNRTDKTWCGEDNFSITSNNFEMLKMTLEDNGRKHSFRFRISTNHLENVVKIECYKPTMTTGSHTSTTTTPSTSSTSINTDCKSITYNPSPTTSSAGLVHPLNTDLSSTNTVPEGGDTTTDKDMRLKEESDDESLYLSSTFTHKDDITTERDIRNSEESPLSVILGCSVGGTVVILLVITIIYVLLRRIKRQKNTSSDTDVNQTGTISQNVYSSPDSVDNYVNDFHRYEHLPKQREPVPDTGIKSENDLSQDNAIGLYINQQNVKRNEDYVNLTKE